MNFTKKNKRHIMELIVFAGVVLWCVFNYNLFIDFIKVVFKLVMPLLVGLAIAFIINVPMKQIEKKIFKIDKRKHKKIIRIISLLLSIILIFGIIGLILFLVIPEFISAVSLIGKNLPSSFEWVNDFVGKMMKLYPSAKNYINNIDIKSVVETTIGTTGSIVSVIMTFLSGMISKVIMFFMGFIISIYILLDKENLVRQTKKLFMAFLPDKTVNPKT